MKKLEDAAKGLSSDVARYNSLQALFNQFQSSIEEAGKATFSVPGISIITKDATTSEVKFLGKVYRVVFAMTKVNNARKGAIQLWFAPAEFEGGTVRQITSVTFDGQGVLDAEQPIGEDPMNVKESSCCLNLLLNWLIEHAVV